MYRSTELDNFPTRNIQIYLSAPFGFNRTHIRIGSSGEWFLLCTISFFLSSIAFLFVKKVRTALDSRLSTLDLHTRKRKRTICIEVNSSINQLVEISKCTFDAHTIAYTTYSTGEKQNKSQEKSNKKNSCNNNYKQVVSYLNVCTFPSSPHHLTRCPLLLKKGPKSNTLTAFLKIWA